VDKAFLGSLLVMLLVHTSTPLIDALGQTTDKGLSAGQTNAIVSELWNLHRQKIQFKRQTEMDARRLKLGELEMPFWHQIYGEKPENGRSLYISLHGGGGVPKEVNDQQWERHKRLYQPKEGIYLVPRAPTNTWNLWHQPHIDKFFGRLIENLIILEDVDPNRVYVMGYSAGGDGVYQIGPRMADRWAAVAMMAGHPNDSKPDSLRNTAFTLHMGALDSAYNRNQVAKKWKELLSQLQANDPGGYKHLVQIHEDKGHWMEGEDQVAIPWMTENTRRPYPEKIVWLQDDVTHNRFYWLVVKGESVQGRSRIVATRNGQRINIEFSTVPTVVIRLNDKMLDLDLPVEIQFRGRSLFQGQVKRAKAVIEKTIAERGDYTGIFSAEVMVDIPPTD